jgi:hypothetical protein
MTAAPVLKSGAIDDALIDLLAADAELKALCPDGVWFGLAPGNCQRFVLVSLILGEDRSLFGGRGFEVVRYTVQAVLLTTSLADPRQAAFRIDQLLEGVPIAVPGYGWMMTQREEHFAYPERDEVNASIVWQHYGGQYRLELTTGE